MHLPKYMSKCTLRTCGWCDFYIKTFENLCCCIYSHHFILTLFKINIITVYVYDQWFWSRPQDVERSFGRFIRFIISSSLNFRIRFKSKSARCSLQLNSHLSVRIRNQLLEPNPACNVFMYAAEWSRPWPQHHDAALISTGPLGKKVVLRLRTHTCTRTQKKIPTATLCTLFQPCVHLALGSCEEWATWGR